MKIGDREIKVTGGQTVEVAKEKMNKKELGDLVLAIRSEFNGHPFVGKDCEALAMLDELQGEIDKLEID